MAANDTATMVADTLTTNGGVFSSFDSGPVINSSGTVAFDANFDRTGSGIFVALSGFNLLQVVREGDTLFGSTVRSVEFWSEGLNDKNQLAFAYELSNGRRGIAVANVFLPVAIPEPSTVALAALGLLAGAGLVARRRACVTSVSPNIESANRFIAESCIPPAQCTP